MMLFLLVLALWSSGVVSQQYELPQTNYDEPWRRECKDGDILVRLQSHHDNSPEDRIWRFSCDKSPAKIDAVGSYSGIVNNWDGPLRYSCPDDSVITGLESEHNNSNEDRRFSFKCNRLINDRLTNCLMSPYINDFDEDMDWTLPDGHVIRGFESYHDNSKEDRRWKVQYCT